MLSLAQLLTLTMSSQAFDVSTTSRGADGLVWHSGWYSTQNSTQPIGGRVGSPTATKALRSLDAPPPPSVQPIYVAPVTVQPNATTASLTISAYATADPQASDRGTAYGEIVYTCTTTPSPGLLGNWVSIASLTGPYAAYANISGTIIAINGMTFTVGGLWFFNFSATGQTGTATVGAADIYATRSMNYVKAYLGATLPANYQRGFWVSLTDASNNPITDTPNLIASISRDTNGIVTVTLEYPWTNLPPGAVVFITAPNASYSGSVHVTSGSATVTWISGDQFDPNWAGQIITLGSVDYVVSSASTTVLVLTTNYTASTGSIGYSLSYAAFGNPSFQTVYQVISSTVFTYQSLVTEALSITGGTGTAYIQWTPQGGTYGNAAQITSTGIDDGGAYVEWFQLGPDESLTLGEAPILTIVGQASPGTHQFALFYENGDGQQTQPSTIVSAEADVVVPAVTPESGMRTPVYAVHGAMNAVSVDPGTNTRLFLTSWAKGIRTPSSAGGSCTTR